MKMTKKQIEENAADFNIIGKSNKYGEVLNIPKLWAAYKSGHLLWTKEHLIITSNNPREAFNIDFNSDTDE